MMSTAAVTIYSDVVCELGEGPSFDMVSGALFWFDIYGRKLYEKRPGSADTIAHALPEETSAVATIDGERQLLFTETGLHVRDRASGRLSLLKPVEADRADMRSNDARVHPCGAFWFGTMPKVEGPKSGTIYWFFRGEVRALYPGIAIPNSICFSPDGSIAYFSDTQDDRVMRVACDPATGLPTGEPVVFVESAGRAGYFDGSVVDLDGVLWNARWGAGSLDAYSPDGRLLESIAIPAGQASCPAFVGAAGDRIAVTSAWTGLDEAARKADPLAGRTFLVDRPVLGRPEPAVLIQ